MLRSEFACRAGLKHDGIILTDKDLDEVAWHAGMLVRQLGKLSKKEMNGVCMIAMVMWLNGPIVEMMIVATKGGSWLMESESTTSSASGLSKIDKRSDAIGLRLVWSPI